MAVEFEAVIAGATIVAWAVWAHRQWTTDLRHELRALRGALADRPATRQ